MDVKVLKPSLTYPPLTFLLALQTMDTLLIMPIR